MAEKCDVDAHAKERKLRFDVLRFVKRQQDKHGVRHQDYTRYARYCSSRLHHLYRSVKFSRVRYDKSKIIVVTDVRILHVLLYHAERAWSEAMAAEQQLLNDGHSRLIARRLSKARKWAEFLYRTCAANADMKTSLLAFAYASFMKGSYLIERAPHRDIAVESARAVCAELGQYRLLEDQVTCFGQGVEKNHIDPSSSILSYYLHGSMGHNVDASEISNPCTTPGAFTLELAMGRTVSRFNHDQGIATTTKEYCRVQTSSSVIYCKASELEKGVANISLDDAAKCTKASPLEEGISNISLNDPNTNN